MKFIVLEIKDRDLFTIYDVEKKGVCCCSAYTLKQLLEAKIDVIGCNVVNGKLKVFECDLDGNKRSRKASNCCTDTTKRSFATIVKGLDEKHYPRVKTERKTDIEERKVFIVNTEVKQYDVKKFILDEKSLVQLGSAYTCYNKNSVTGLVLNVTDSMVSVYSLDEGKQIRLGTSVIKEVKSTRLTEDKRKFYEQLTKDQKKVNALRNKKQSLEMELEEERKKLIQKYQGKLEDLYTQILAAEETLKANALKSASKMNVALTQDEVIQLLKEKLKTKLWYSYTGYRGCFGEDDVNEFEISIVQRDAKVQIKFRASVECREDYMWIKDNIGHVEYDGTLSIDSRAKKGPDASPYFDKLRCGLHNGKKIFYYGSNGEVSKGYFTKNFVYQYDFDGIKYLTRDLVNKIIERIS